MKTLRYQAIMIAVALGWLTLMQSSLLGKEHPKGRYDGKGKSISSAGQYQLPGSSASTGRELMPFSFAHPTNTADFSEPTPISDPGASAYSPNLIRLGGDSVLVVYALYGNLATRLSINGGVSWEPSLVDWEIWCGVCPSAFADTSGTIQVYYIAGEEIYHTSSADRGVTWDPVEAIYTFSSTPSSSYLAASTVADGSIWFNFILTEQGGHILRRFQNGSFGEEISLNSTFADQTRSGRVYSLTNDTLLLVYSGRVSGNREILMQFSYDNGLTWTGEDTLFSDPGVDRDTYLYVDSADTAWLVFSSVRGTRFGYNLWYSKSGDNGASWDPPSKFTDYAGSDLYPSLLEVGSRMLIAWKSVYRQGWSGIWLGDIYQTSDANAPPYALFPSVFPGVVGEDAQKVMVEAYDEDQLTSVELVYSIDEISQPDAMMYDDGTHEDENPADNVYTTEIGSFMTQVEIVLQVKLADLDGNSLSFPLDPYYLTISEVQDGGNLWTIYNSTGEIGTMDVGRPSMEWPGGSGNNYLFTGGFWVGAKVDHMPAVSIQYYDYTDWNALTNLEVGNDTSDKDLRIRFNDEYADNPIGVEVDQRGYSWADSLSRDFIVLDYTIYNSGQSGPLDSVYFGLWSDFDVSDFPGSDFPAVDDTLGFDYSRDLIFMFDGDNPAIPEDDTGEPDDLGTLQSPGYIGMALLSPADLDVHLSWWEIGSDPDVGDEETLFNLLSDPPNVSAPESVGDYRILLSVGPMSIPVLDSVRVVVGYVIGDGLAELQANTDQMKMLFGNGFISSIAAKQGLPGEFRLYQNYPNPFNPTTILRFELPVAADIRFVVYDLIGREIVRLMEGHRKPGYYQVTWIGHAADGSEVPSGIYIARLITPEYTKSIKMVLLK
ncbi:MAG: T9SS type A sorting domain-containing protein [Fidelibacterota bacterium]|nr:MAG: T9SS type A sorting domain-containing protein [Candidatus Neomarinimicrobiota bacterium]